MAKKVRISLANKCQLLFGAAVILILAAALAVVWHRMQGLILEGQRETARKLAQAWLDGKIHLDMSAPKSIEETTGSDTLKLINKDEFDSISSKDPFLAESIEQFQTRNDRYEVLRAVSDSAGRTYFRYAKAIRRSDLGRIGNGAAAGFEPGLDAAPGLPSPLEMVLSIELHSEGVAVQVARNRFYILFAGLFAGLLAIAAFWFITTRLILSPVRVLRETAEKVADGDLNIRADINTGDEFEQLSDIFNHMLENLKASQEQLAGINKSLDLKLGELAESNVALYEANKIKGEFLANVSHELRTPLNSIVGFAEILEETLKDRTGPVDEKRKRYAANIITSSRRLLDLINDLLDLAKIEAGRIELHLAPMSVEDTIEGLVNLIRPQAEKRQIELRLKVEPNLRPILTDASKLQQILFNFLSNAIKFTPPSGVVTLAAYLVGPDNLPTTPGFSAPPGTTGTPGTTGIPGITGGIGHPVHPAPPSEVRIAKIEASLSGGASAGSLGSGASGGSGGSGAIGNPAAWGKGEETTTQRLCISVNDTGPGIAVDQHERIFEKFTQLDSTVTRQHEGTGLGLTICRELAALLQGQIMLDSDTGRGATFSIIIPLVLETRSMPLMPERDGRTAAQAGA